MTRQVAILVFPDAEVLDFAGPYEVFSVAGSRADPPAFRVFLVAETLDVILARNGFKVVPDYTLETCPPAELLVVPGGRGTRPLLERPAIVEWIRSRAAKAEVVMSVCSGALLLGKAGLLDGLAVTTHHGALGELAAIAPKARIDASVRYHDHGRIAVSAGISAGIDCALHLVARLCGPEVAADTAHHMEYRLPA